MHHPAASGTKAATPDRTRAAEDFATTGPELSDRGVEHLRELVRAVARQAARTAYQQAGHRNPLTAENNGASDA